MFALVAKGWDYLFGTLAVVSALGGFASVCAFGVNLYDHFVDSSDDSAIGAVRLFAIASGVCLVLLLLSAFMIGAIDSGGGSR